MKIADFLIPVNELTSQELSPEESRLIDSARNATQRAYAPYSHFSVGAAILLSDGTIIEGSNQENSAFPSGLCAERTAAFYAHSRYPDLKFEKIAIAARGTDGRETRKPVTPCGACRQVLLEYEKLAGKNVEVLLYGTDTIYRIPAVKYLLPLSFTDFS